MGDESRIKRRKKRRERVAKAGDREALGYRDR